MAKILKNTTASPITISDVGGTIIPASPATYTISPRLYDLWASSSNILTYLNDTAGFGGGPSLIVNDGSFDLSPNRGASFILEIYPNFEVFNALIFNPTTSPTPDTETSQALPTSTRRFILINRSNYILKYAFAAGDTVGGNYLTLFPNARHIEGNIGAANLTLYYQVPGINQRIEILAWT